VLPIDEATRRVFDGVSPLGVERVPLGEAQGRFLAAPLEARFDDPAFDASAMDGYAVRAADVAEVPASLRVAGESRAGEPSAHALKPGEAVRIFTGAGVPEGADAVVIQEDTDRDGDTVVVKEAAGAGANVRVAGEVIRAGEPLLAVGASMDPGAIAFAASQGHAMVSVHRRPRVAILSTGDELRELGAPRGPGDIYDSNTHGLAAAVRAAGGVPVVLPLGADTEDALVARITEGLACDALVSTGGVSVGEYDLVRGALERAGVAEIFWKVRLKPGKPVRYGRSEAGVPAFGLPGNPVSTMVTFEVFVRPVLRAMLGDPRPHRPRRRVTLSRPARAPGTRTELARARLEGDVAHVLPSRGSGDLSSLVGLEALVVMPQGAGEVREADAIDVRPGARVATSPWEA